ncbi:vesicle-associated membrane protein-associated protein B/C [Trichinella spiralis]|uniref:vesicle-associated membrane protein-associated protein B/C n=1 Tax=Trichinella spiralis TaxID=6334 RepID=UPI0001EFD910|nr:vesicle-associated membrane protein-associated protein B/C [Trichinella spiralis]
MCWRKFLSSAMSKPIQVLQLYPEKELVFKGPFTKVVTTTLQLTNPTDKTVCFKVKTTAPKQYYVRPNMSWSFDFEINEAICYFGKLVMLQPLLHDNPAELRHKFMVQSAFMPESGCNLETIWKSVPDGGFMDSKLRAVLLPVSEEEVEDFTSDYQQHSSSSSGIEAEYRSLLDHSKKLQSQLDTMHIENQALRVQKMNFSSRQLEILKTSSSENLIRSNNTQEDGMNMVAVIGVAVVADTNATSMQMTICASSLIYLTLLLLYRRCRNSFYRKDQCPHGNNIERPIELY